MTTLPQASCCFSVGLVAVHGDKASMISTRSRMELRSSGFEDNKLAYIFTGLSVLCTLK